VSFEPQSPNRIEVPRFHYAWPHRKMADSGMAVSPHLRGRGLGRCLPQHAIVKAKRLGAKSLFLGNNTRLKDAVHLYESVGFHHVKPETLPPMPYSRADVFMEMQLG
jgi:putative acetyltransferase